MDMSPFSFGKPKDKSGRLYEQSSCRIIITSTSGIARWIMSSPSTSSLPEQEKYNLASQLRRAGTSAPLNIAEGCGAASNTEFGRFLGFAYRSLKEVVTALELCERLYPSMPPHRMQSLIDEGNQISKMTYNLMQKVDPGNHLR
jgi:four helix bundle protein